MKIRSILTNLAYVAVGIWAIIQAVVAPGTYTALLGLASGVHHHYLEDWSRQLDYSGMYGAITALSLWMLGASTELNLSITALLTGALSVILKVSSTVVVALIGLCLAIFAVTVDFFWTMVLLSILMLAFSFNELGDTKMFSKFHGIFHGQVWHVWTAVGIMIMIKLVLLYG